jgi:hypothetical protein
MWLVYIIIGIFLICTIIVILQTIIEKGKNSRYNYDERRYNRICTKCGAHQVNGSVHLETVGFGLKINF